MASMTKISSNAMRMANTCIVYNNDHTRTEKLSNCTRKTLLANKKMGNTKTEKALTMTTEQTMASTMTKTKTNKATTKN